MKRFAVLLKSILSKINFFIQRNPKIERYMDPKTFIPKGYKSVLLISADFEFAWAWRYANNKSPKTVALNKARLERKNIPRLVKLCEDFDIPVTWATVGHLLLESCERRNGIAHGELPRLSNFENDYWRYSGRDWFEHDPCTGVNTDPEWYCPDLIKLILDSPIRHEIGCHTFSHIDCSDDVCPPEILMAELQACKQLADEWNLELTSFVHPGHTIGNLDTLAREGFTNFRTNYRNVLGSPKKHDNGLWQFEQTAELVYRKEWSIGYHTYRYKEIIKRAINSNTICVIWFHPSFDMIMVDKILPSVFAFIQEKKDQIWVATHKEYINWIEKFSIES